MLNLRIEQDIYPTNPREDHTQFATMFCAHRRYDLGDRQTQNVADIEAFEEECDWTLPLYLYDHSGITMSTGPFSCPWDSGRVGTIGITREQLAETGLEVNEENALTVMRQEVEEYDQYLRGDIWYYVIEDDDGNVLDSLSDMYGYDYAEEEGKRMLEYLEAKTAIKDPTGLTPFAGRDGTNVSYRL